MQGQVDMFWGLYRPKAGFLGALTCLPGVLLEWYCTFIIDTLGRKSWIPISKSEEEAIIGMPQSGLGFLIQIMDHSDLV